MQHLPFIAKSDPGSGVSVRGVPLLRTGRTGLRVERQKYLPLVYRGLCIGRAFRIDLLVEGLVVVEVKSVERLERIHSAQVLSYLRMLNCRVGLLINFNTQWLVRDGVRRIVNGFPE